MRRLRPDDVGLKIQVANQFARSGQTTLPLAQYKAAFRRDPVLASRSFSQIESMLLKTGKTEELLQLLDEIDLRFLGDSSSLSMFIQSLPESPGSVERIRSVYRKTWETFPQQSRVQLLVYVWRDDIWQMPQMYDYAREAIIPTAHIQSGSFLRWYPFIPIAPSMNPTTNLRATVTIQPPISRFLDLADSQGRLDEFVTQVEEARRAIPGCAPADGILALAHLRAGNYGEARRRALALFKHFKTDAADSAAAASLYSLWTVGLELEKQPATRNLAVTAYADSLNSPFGFVQLSNAVQHPVHRLAELLRRDGRADEARAMLLTMVHARRFPDTYDQEAVRQFRMSGLPVIGRELVRLGFASDAVLVFQEALALADQPARPTNVIIAAMDSFNPSAIRDDLDHALNGLDRGELSAAAGRSIASALQGDRTHQNTDASSDTRKSPSRDQVIELAPMLHPRRPRQGDGTKPGGGIAGCPRRRSAGCPRRTAGRPA